MKKYILVLFALAFALGLFNINAGSVSAARCAPGERFNSDTGLLCATPITSPECASGEQFSSVTGRPCITETNSDKLIITEPIQGWGGWSAGTAYAIRWTNIQDPHIPKIFVTMTKPNGTRRINITNHPEGYFPYLGDGMSADPQVSIPDSVRPGNYKIFLTDRAGGTRVLSNVVDVTISESDSNQPSITVISPNGGETFTTGKSYPIKWKAENLPRNSKVMIELRGWSYPLPTQTIDIVKVSDLSYRWTVPSSLPSGDYRIEIYHIGPSGTPSDGLAKAISQNSFTITSATQPSITVISPNGGETLTRGTQATITWNQLEAMQVSLNASVENGSYTIATVISGVAGQNSFAWTVGNGLGNFVIPDGRYKIMVHKYNAAEVNDKSDSSFSIATQPSITLVSQNLQAVALDNEDYATGTFSFDVYSPSKDIFISRANPRELVQVLFDGRRDIGIPKVAVLTTPGNSSGDTTDYFIIEEDEDRRFVLTFSIEPTQGSGYYRAEATALKMKDGDLIRFGDEFATNAVLLRGNATTPSITVTNPNGGVFDNGRSQNIIVSWQQYVGDFDYYTVNVINTIANVGKRISGSISKESNGFTITSGAIQDAIIELSGTTPAPEQGYYFDVFAIKVDAGEVGVATGRSGTFSITSPTTRPSLTLTASPTSISVGQHAVITWSSQNATSCTGTSTGGESPALWGPGPVEIGTSGRETAESIMLGNATFTVTCTGPGGSVTKSVTVALATTGTVLGTESFHFTQFLEEGSRGNEVRELQKSLNARGYDAGNVDGIFGAKVKGAVIKFQTDNQLKVDGIVGYEVRSLLNK